MGRGFCSKHYRKFKRHGDPLGGRSYRAPEAVYRLIDGACFKECSTCRKVKPICDFWPRENRKGRADSGGRYPAYWPPDAPTVRGVCKACMALRAATVNRRLKSRYQRMLSQGKRSGIKVLISLEEYASIITGAACHYCCGQISGVAGYGLDRIMRRGHYSLDNIVPCCKTCNTIKMGLENRYGDLAYEKMLAISALLREEAA